MFETASGEKHRQVFRRVVRGIAEVRKSIGDNTRLDAQRRFLLDADEGDTAFTYNRGQANEPFALLHRH